MTCNSRLASLALPFAVACTSVQAGTTSGRAELVSERMDELLELKLIDAYPGSTDPEALAMLDLEVASNEAFERALAAYGAHDYRSAAHQFMAATEPILVARSAFNGEIMAGNRLACYTAILILAAFCQPIVIIFHEIAIYCADGGQNENCCLLQERAARMAESRGVRRGSLGPIRRGGTRSGQRRGDSSTCRRSR